MKGRRKMFAYAKQLYYYGASRTRFISAPPQKCHESLKALP